MEQYDVIIIGASITGNNVAELLSKKNYRVLLIEEHKQIGIPSKCTGLVSWRLLELLPNLPKNIIVNKINSAKFYFPNNNCLELKSKNPVYVIDRTALDNYVFDKAKKNGVEIRTGEKFETYKLTNDSIEIKTNKKIYHSKILIGADGANSLVRKHAKIKTPKNALLGLQTTAKGKFDSNTVELWFGTSISPNFFGWVVPENKNTARVGLAVRSNPNKFYNNFLKKRIGYIKTPDTGGLIRYGLMSETSSDRLMLIGDAACQVKPFSGGGIIYGLIASKMCANACINAIDNNTFNKNFLRNVYDKKWKEKLSLPIMRGLALRKLFNRMPDKGLNMLIYFAAHSKRFLENWDMDLL